MLGRTRLDLRQSSVKNIGREIFRMSIGYFQIAIEKSLKQKYRLFRIKNKVEKEKEENRSSACNNLNDPIQLFCASHYTLPNFSVMMPSLFMLNRVKIHESMFITFFLTLFFSLPRVSTNV